MSVTTMGPLGSSSKKLAILADVGGSDEGRVLIVSVAAIAMGRRKLRGIMTGRVRRRGIRKH